MATHAPSRKRPKILLVDDEPRVLEGLSLALDHRRYEVVCAGSADEALAVLKAQPIDVVVSDERMPGRGGSELLAIVARDWPQVARIILTGQATVDAAVRAINDGRIFRFLLKPCPADQLTRAVDEALEAMEQQKLSSRLLQAARDVLSLQPAPAPAPAAPAPVSAVPSLAVGGFPAELMRTLTTREREIFEFLVEGYRVAQIAKRLFVSPHTARNHVKSILAKLRVHSQADLVAKARSAPSPVRMG